MSYVMSAFETRLETLTDESMCVKIMSPQSPAFGVETPVMDVSLFLCVTVFFHYGVSRVSQQVSRHLTSSAGIDFSCSTSS